ncbi:MAG TPA: sugar phosphate isomerase/epimerase [Opitutaceae bacterium]
MNAPGFVSAILPDLSFEEVIGFAREADYKCAELCCWPVGKAERRYAGVTHLDVATLTDARAAEVNAFLAEQGVFLSGLGYYPNPMEADAERAAFFREHIRKVIVAAHRLGLRNVNTFVGRNQMLNETANLKLFAEVWPPLVKFAAEHGVSIGIENCPMYFTDDEWPKGQNLAYSPVLWRRMFEIIPDANFGLNYDPSHLLWMQMDYLKPLRDFTARLRHLHLKDAHVYRDRLDEHGILANPLTFHTPKLPGRGDIDWSAYFATLREINWMGPLVVEVEDKDYEGSLADRKRSLRECREFLREWVP